MFGALFGGEVLSKPNQNDGDIPWLEPFREALTFFL
jgi:hypothetical protein